MHGQYGILICIIYEDILHGWYKCYSRHDTTFERFEVIGGLVSCFHSINVWQTSNSIGLPAFRLPTE
jgi:hypothetical protein